MSAKNIQIEINDVNGNNLYPKTTMDSVFNLDSSNVTVDKELKYRIKKGINLEFIKCIMTSTDIGDDSIYFPSVIKTRHTGALGKYYMFYSYDHAYGNGKNVGIKLAYSDDLENWTLYGGSNTAANVLNAKTHWPNYSSTGAEQETETPCVFYDEQTKKYIMTWHSSYAYDGAGYAQNTYISYSDDCITWTYKKVALKCPLSHFPGNGHDGYWQTWRFGNRYIATILFGGGSGYMTTAYSDDGYDWLMDPRLTNGVNSEFKKSGTVTQSAYELHVEFNQSALFELNGKYYKLGGAGAPTSGTTPKDYALYIMEVMADMKTPAGPATLLRTMDTTVGECTNIRLTTCLNDDGQIYIIYNTREGTSGVSKFFLAKLNYEL